VLAKVDLISPTAVKKRGFMSRMLD